MKTTIIAEVRYRVMFMSEAAKERYSWAVSELENRADFRLLYDGDVLIMPCVKTDLERFNDERVGNECFHLCEYFETSTGFWAYWRDEETDTDFITKIEQKG